MFYLLEENKYLDHIITEKMVRAVGFRNFIVHEYGKVNLKQVFEVAKKDIIDLKEYLMAIFRKSGLRE